MILRNAVLAAAIAAAAFTAVPAKADVTFGFDFGDTGIYFSGDDDQMSPQDVRRMLRHRGYHDIDFSDTDGTFYKLTATKHGDDYFIVVNSYSGDIVQRHEI
jgi:hypothetical protein